MAKKRSKKTTEARTSPVGKARNLSRVRELILYVQAGGRCEFDGCNKYLLRNPLTLTAANYGKKAHIVAFREDGPRGRQGHRPKDINALSNLMLLCQTCHDEIDKHPEKYSRTTLQKHKVAHEKRIALVTDAGPDRRTSIVQLRARIGGKDVAIPAPDVFKAVAPRYPENEQGLLIDLSEYDDRNSDASRAAIAKIDDELRPLFAPRMKGDVPEHVSLFAFGPIPFLIHLGCRLSDKVPVDFFQFHRDTKSWTWKKRGTPADYSFRRLRAGSDPQKVALLLSLSGTISPDALSSEIDQSFSIYELTLESQTPNTMFLNTRDDLMAFRKAYQQLLGDLLANHGKLETIHLFPAVPLPVAVICGHDLLNKTHPSLTVYDHDKAKGGFTYQLKVNEQ